MVNRARIVFRTDASLEIGTGHVMRCLMLAEALRKDGAEVSFISRELPGNMIDHVEGKGLFGKTTDYVQRSCFRKSAPVSAIGGGELAVRCGGNPYGLENECAGAAYGLPLRIRQEHDCKRAKFVWYALLHI